MATIETPIFKLVEQVNENNVSIDPAGGTAPDNEENQRKIKNIKTLVSIESILKNPDMLGENHECTAKVYCYKES